MIAEHLRLQAEHAHETPRERGWRHVLRLITLQGDTRTHR